MKGSLKLCVLYQIPMMYTLNILQFYMSIIPLRGSLVAQTVKNLLAIQEIRVWSLGWKDSLEKEMVIHSSILAWRIPWIEEPSGLQSMGSQSWTWLTNTHTHTHTHTHAHTPQHSFPTRRSSDLADSLPLSYQGSLSDILESEKTDNK